MYPAPRVFHTGDIVSIKLWTAPDTGQTIIDDIHIDAMFHYAMTGTAAPPGLMAQTTQAKAAAMAAAGQK